MSTETEPAARVEEHDDAEVVDGEVVEHAAATEPAGQTTGPATEPDESTVEDPESSTAIEVHRPTPTLLPSEHEWAGIMQIAHGLEKANLVPKDLRGRAPDIALVLLYGRDLGLRPSVALSRIHVIEGRPSLSAEVMAALVRQAGHRIEMVCTLCGYTENERDEAKEKCPDLARHAQVTLQRGCQVRGTRGDDGTTMTVEWTMFDAQQAELAFLDDTGLLVRKKQGTIRKDGKPIDVWLWTKDNWWHHPKSMLWARCISQLVRMLFPDVTSGLSYTGEELGAQVDEHGEVIDVEGFDVPPGERSSLDDFGVEPMSDEAKAAIKARIDALPGDLRKQAATTWNALIRQTKLSKLEELRVGHTDTVETLLRPLEAKAAKAAAEPTDAEVVATTAADGRCLQCALSGGQHEPGCPNGPDPAPEPDPTPDAEPNPPATPDLPDTPAAESNIGGGDSTADVADGTDGDVDVCGTCETPIWRNDGGAWHHAFDEDVCASPAPAANTRATETIRPGAELADPAAPAPAEPAGLATRDAEDMQRERRATALVGKMSHVEVVKWTEAYGQSTHGTPKMVRARLIEFLYKGPEATLAAAEQAEQERTRRALGGKS